MLLRRWLLLLGWGLGAAPGQTDCDYTVTADGTSVTINRNPPGPEDEVEIYFVIEESDAG